MSYTTNSRSYFGTQNEKMAPVYTLDAIGYAYIYRR
jgi:hypothetical protein